MNILDKIKKHKILEVKSKQSKTPLAKLIEYSHYKRNSISLSDILYRSKGINIIAEYKRGSPSKGIINTNKSSVETVASQYEQYGASAMSVLTDQTFFRAEENDFNTARDCTSFPILRKEFIISEYQIHETKAMGADVLLLIAAMLSEDELTRFTNTSQDIGIEVLYEIHDENDIKKMPKNVDVIGVNNRDLKTFKVNHQHSINMLKLLPDGYPKISESGISKPDTVLDLYKAGFNGFLMGEAFMKEDNPGLAFKNFISDCQNKLLEL